MPIPHFSKTEAEWRSRPIGLGLSPRRKKIPRRRMKRNLLKKIIIFSITFFLIGTIALGGVFIWLGRELPDPDKLLERSLPQSTKIYDRTGKTVLYEVYGEQKRTLVKLEDIPNYVKWATIAMEDKDFYKHGGISLWGIFRGVVWQTLQGKKSQGGSTLTQQFVKNSLLTSERTVERKLKEWILSYEMEKKYSKDEILQMYLNEIPYGSTAYGVESASNFYFNKSAKDLTLDEGALLAALTQAPTYYSPYGNHTDILKDRQHYILDLMAQQGYITSPEAEEAKKVDTLKKIVPQKMSFIAPHFVMYVKELLEEKYGPTMVEEGGLKVYTTLDLEKQKIAEDAVKWGAEKNEKNYGASNAALISLDPKTGQVLAMVGSKDYFDTSIDGNVNVALRPRQPGSSFKPIVYATAFKKGYAPDTILFDLVTNFGPQGSKNEDYIPHNYDNKEHGPVTIKKALAGSLNIPAVKTLYLTGVDNVLDLAERMGYTTFQDRSRFGLSLVLGGGEVKLLEHASAFGVFATEGVRHPVVSILKVEDEKGNVLEEYEETDGEKVLDEEICRQIIGILSDNSARSYIFGEQNSLVLKDRPVAAKTGTTNDFRDGWTMGFTPSLVTGVWVGNNDNKEMSRKADGSNVAAPIWNKFMSEALKNTPVENFTPPQPVEVDKPILKGQMEGEYKVKIDRASGKLATDLTPPSFVEEKTYKEVHDILYYVDKDNPRGPVPANPKDDPQYERWEEPVQKWLKSQGYAAEKPPTEYDDLHIPENSPLISIVSPADSILYSDPVIKAEVSVSAPRGVSRVEYFIDGQPVDTIKNSPYAFRCFANDFENGYHTLTAKAYDDIDNSGEASVRISLYLKEEAKIIRWLKPDNQSVVYSYNFPLNLSVLIPQPTKVKRVKFYYLDTANFQPFLIGMISNPLSPVVSLAWEQMPPSGNYRLYVELIDESENVLRSDYLNLEVR